MKMKSTELPKYNMFRSVDQNVASGRVYFLAHQNLISEANIVVPILARIMQEKYGPRIWNWFFPSAKENIKGYKWSEKRGVYTDEEEFRPRKRTRGGKTPKKRRSSIGRNHRGVGVGLDLHLGGSTQESVSISNASTRRKRSSASTSNRRKTRRSRLPSPAMEKLGNTSASQLTSSKTKTSGTIDTAQTGKISRKSNTLRPAMSILDETKMAANKSNESQNKDKE